MKKELAKTTPKREAVMPSRSALYTKFIETELYYFDATKREFENYKEELYEISARPLGVKDSRVADPTQTKALLGVSSLVLKEMERRIRAVENVRALLAIGSEPRKLDFLELKYFKKKYSDTALMLHLGIEQATFYRWKKEILQLVAEGLGLNMKDE